MKTPKHSGRHDSFGGAVRETRARRGLSQEELGARARLHRNYVGAIERGEINPTLRVLYKLACGLELPAWEILKLADERHVERIGTPSRERLEQTHGAARVVRR
jgi:transcriptional regulator with XRE-family HTH domain